jgi:hypothetical protein
MFIRFTCCPTVWTMLLGAVALCATLRADEKQAEPSPQQQLQVLFAGDKQEAGPYLPLVRDAKTATVFRIGLLDPTAEKSVGGFPILDEPVKVDGKSASELSAVLADPTTYAWDRGRSFCGFVPGVAVRFAAKDKNGKELRLVALICFHCNEIQISANRYPPAGSMKAISADGRRKLLAHMKRLFPKDEQLQALPAELPKEEAEKAKPEERLAELFGGGRILKDFVGSDYLDLIKNAESATIYRTDEWQDLTRDDTIAGYKVLGKPQKLDGELLKELGKVLTDHKTYGWDESAHVCGFSPGVAIRYSGKNEYGDEIRVVVLLCFMCEDIKLYHNSPLAENEMTNITPGRRQLVKLVKKMFPEDAEIQQLEEVLTDKEELGGKRPTMPESSAK